jgi:4-hydroxybenzoate polyprenyltransferase
MGLAHGASQALNMAEDAEMDRNTPHKQNRPIPSGIITEEEARTLAWIAILAAVGRAYITDTTFGVFVSVLVFFGIFYNLSPIRAKERIISIPWQAASRGLLSFPTIWAAYGNPWQPFPWVLGTFMFFYVLSFQNSADIIDREVDEEYGIKTFVVVLGVKRTMFVALGGTIAMIATLGIGVAYGIVPVELLSMLLIIPFCAWMLWTMWDRPYTIDETTGNHPAWLWFYVGMVLCVVIPFATELAYL